MDAVIDTGANTSAASVNALRKARLLPYVCDVPAPYINADGRVTEGKGKLYDVPFAIGRLNTTIDLTVTEASNYDLLIGTDVLDLIDANINFGKHEFTFQVDHRSSQTVGLNLKPAHQAPAAVDYVQLLQEPEDMPTAPCNKEERTASEAVTPATPTTNEAPAAAATPPAAQPPQTSDLPEPTTSDDLTTKELLDYAGPSKDETEVNTELPLQLEAEPLPTAGEVMAYPYVQDELLATTTADPQHPLTTLDLPTRADNTPTTATTHITATTGEEPPNSGQHTWSAQRTVKQFTHCRGLLTAATATPAIHHPRSCTCLKQHQTWPQTTPAPHQTTLMTNPTPMQLLRHLRQHQTTPACCLHHPPPTKTTLPPTPAAHWTAKQEPSTNTSL
jgi:hypothetical protein